MNLRVADHDLSVLRASRAAVRIQVTRNDEPAGQIFLSHTDISELFKLFEYAAVYPEPDVMTRVGYCQSISWRVELWLAPGEIYELRFIHQYLSDSHILRLNLAELSTLGFYLLRFSN